MKLVPIIIFVAGCTVQTAPVAPVPETPDPPGTCETARMRLAELGSCGMDLDRFVADCRAAEVAEADLDIKLPVGCLTNAPDCAAAERCR